MCTFACITYTLWYFFFLSILDAWLVDDEVQVAVEVLQDDVNSENETEEEREADDGEVPSKDCYKQPKRNALLALCAVVGISVAVAVPLSMRPTPGEEEPDTRDQAVPWEVSTTSSTTDDGKVHKAPLPSFISDAISAKYRQFSQGIDLNIFHFYHPSILDAPGLASFYGDCRTAAISVDEDAVQIVKYNEINDMWDVMNELREDGFGAERVELAKINQVLAVSRPSDEPNNTGSIKLYTMNSSSEWSSLGDDIGGTEPSLSVEGDVLASVVHVADEEDRVRVYRFDVGIENWIQLGSDIIVGESMKTYARISQFGDYLVLGATLDELGLGSLRVFKLNDEEEWSQVGKTLYDKSSVYPLLINMHGDTIATSGFDIEGLPRTAVYRYQPDEDEWTQEGSFDGVITVMSADGKRLGICSSRVCYVHNYYDISKEYEEVASYSDFVPLHFERGGFSNLESGVCGIATSNSKTTLGYTTVPW